MGPLVKSGLSVVGGLFFTAVIVGLGAVAASAIFLGGADAAVFVEPTPGYLVTDLAVNVAAAMIGGYITATVSDHSPLGHAAVLGAVMIAMGLLSLATNGWQPAQGQPSWYPWVVMAAAVPAAVCGGWWVGRRSAPAPVKRYSRRARAADRAAGDRE